MAEKNNCCRIFPIVVILISLVLAATIWYFEEGVHEFSFLASRGEFINYLGTVLFISILPIGLFYWLNDKDKYRDRARPLALLGFLPALIFLVFLNF